MALFADMLSFSHIKILKMNGRLDEEAIIVLSKALPKSKLQELILTECSISKDAAKALSDGILGSKLRDLFLDDNDLDDDAVTVLATCFQNSQLTNVNLSDSCLSSRGIVAVSSALPSSKITELDFYGNNDVDMDALIHLAETLPQSKVVDLGMGSIHLDVPGMIAVGRILRSCPLTHLNISYNTLSLEMVQTLISCFPACKLVTLNLCGCSLIPETCKLILDSLPLSFISNLDISENDMKSPSTFSSLYEALSLSKLKNLSLTETNLTLSEITKIIRKAKERGIDIDSDFPRLLGDRLRRDDCHSLIFKLAGFLEDV